MGTGFAGDFAVIDRFATSLLGAELQIMEAAKREIHAADLPAEAFGLVGSFFVSGDYKSSWEYQRKNIDEGIQKFLDMVDALRVVAHTYQKAEDANAMYRDGKFSNVNEVRAGAPQAPDQTPNPANVGLIGVLGLELLYQAIMGVLAVGASVSWAAVASVAAWAVTEPNDEALSHAIGKWKGAEAQAVAFNDAFSNKITQYLVREKGWTKGDALEAFTSFTNVFKGEVTQTKEAATANHTALTTIAKDLTAINTIFFVTAVALVSMMLVFAVLEKVPHLAASMKTLKEMAGTSLAVITGRAVAGAAEVISIGGALVTAIGGAGWAFARPVANVGGVGTDFKQIRIDWDSPAVP